MASPTDFSPTLTLPGSIGIPALAPVYVDGIPAAHVIPPRPKPTDSQRFWSTQVRPPGDPTRENLVVSIAKAKEINYLSLDVPHFPHNVRFYFWNLNTQRWNVIRRPNGTPLVIHTAGSVPAIVNNPAALASGLNPYHYGAGHWVHHDEQVQPFTSNKIRLSCVRHHIGGDIGGAGSFPVGPGGHHVAYPLGARNLDFGLRLLSAGDFPWRPRSPDVLTEREPCATADDVNGSPLLVAMRENRATDLLRGLTWRCAPQARSDAVVSLYVDSRDADGNPQAIDRFFINPVTSGPRLNLYYSPDPPPPVSFQALDDPILAPLVTSSGSQIPTATSSGLQFSKKPGWVTLSNQGTGASPGVPWWVALQISPNFASSDPGSYMVADAGLLRLYYSAGTWTLQLAGEAGTGILAAWTFTFKQGDALTFAGGYDGSAFFAWNPAAALVTVPIASPVTSASVIRFGGDLSAETELSPLAGNYLLRAFVLKQEQLELGTGVPQPLLDFAADAGAYVAPDGGTADSTMNAVARFHGSFVLGATNPTGFVGGVGSAYESCSWIPVTRDYTVARGYLEFEPVRASVFKFEFTALQPAPFDYIVPPVQHTKLFEVDQAPPANSTTPVTLDVGMDVTQSVAPSVTYSDAPLPTIPPAPGASLPTEALFLRNPAAAAQLAQTAGSMYNFHPWQVDPSGKRHQTAGPHSYHEVDLPVVSRIGYFVALSSLGMFQFDATAATDTAQYVETFGSTASIDQGTLAAMGAWSWQPGALISPPNITDHAQVQSQVLSSAHKVTGLQFATVQSPAVQLLDSPGFEDTTLQTWTATGDSLPLQIADVSAQLGNMVQVTRLARVYGWAFVQSTWATWDVLMAQNPNWDDLQANSTSTSYGGMAYIGTPVPTTQAGRLYAAARVFSPVALTEPLALQLLDGDTGAVIAESDQVINGGTVTEWFVGYTLGDTIPGTQTWAGLQATYATWNAIEAISTLGAQLEFFGFEDGTEGWSGTHATIAQSTDWAQSGTYSLKITSSGAGGPGFWEAISPGYPVTPGQLYGVSGVVRAGGATIGVTRVQVNWHNSSDVFLSSAVTGPVSIAPAVAQTFVFSGLQAPAGAAFAHLVVIDSEGSTDGTIMYADDVSFYLAQPPPWSIIDTTQPPAGTTVTAQLIQKNSTNDVWFVDDISVFEDALIWEFSNDGGASWYPAYDIRNNPSGALLFPPPAQGQGNQLMWRLKGYRPGLSVSSLVIRPWYSIYPHGVLPRAAGLGYGPNRSPIDNYCLVEDDPRWKVSNSPIPESWYFGIRQTLGLQQPPSYPPADTVPDGFTVGTGLVYLESEAEPVPPPTYSDFYTDIFTDVYGIPDGGDIYTDTYCDTYGAIYTDPSGSGFNFNVQPSPALVLGALRPGSATLSEAASMDASGEVIVPFEPEIGAALGQVAGGSGTVTSFITLTGQPLAVRRVYLGNQIPASLAASIVAADAGVRRVSIDFQPDETTTPDQLDAFLASCQAGGLDAEITLWSGVNMTSGNGTQWSIDGTVWYQRMLEAYVPVIRRNNYAHVWVAANHAIVKNNVLATWYPGDDLVDMISPTFYCQGPRPGVKGSDTLAVVSAFADAHAKPLGLSEFAVDHAQFSQTQGNDFLGYVKTFFTNRAAAGKPAGDLIYFNVNSGGTYALATAPASYVTLYQQIGAAL